MLKSRPKNDTASALPPPPRPRSRFHRIIRLSCALCGLGSATAQDVQITGDVTPSPASSPVWNIAGQLIVGSTGNGTLSISNSGTVSDTSAVIANGAASVSSVSVIGGLWTNSSFIAVGNSGNGTLTVSGNGTVFSTTTALAVNPGSTGSLQLLGGTLTARQVSEGSGNGTVTLNDGTLRLTGDQTNLFAGFEDGDVTLTGSSTIDTQGFNAATALGLTGIGDLNKRGTGTLTLTGSNTYTGRTHVRDGTLALTGTGAISGSVVMHVGESAGEVGTFILYDDAVVNATSSRLGRVAASTGIANVTGGTWSNSSHFWVGELGSGTLNLSNGTIYNQIGFIAALPGSTGTANVSGGSWLNAADIGLGNGGNGTLNLSGSGLVSSRSVLVSGVAGTTGNLNLNGGTLRTGQVSESSGNGTVNFNGGTLQLTGDQSALFSGFEAGDVVLTNSGGTIDTQGFNVTTALALTGNGSLTKTGDGTLTLGNATSSYTGATVVNGGVLSVGRLAVGGTNSAIGASSRAAENLVVDGGTLRFTDAAIWSSDRLFTIGAGGATLEAAGATGRVIFADVAGGVIALTGSGSRTLVLDGLGNGVIFRRGLADSGSGTTALTKNGSGTWSWDAIGTGLGNALNYTGPTSVNAGTLIFNYSASGNTRTLNSAVTIAAGAEFRLSNDITELGSLAGAGTLRVGTSGETLAQLIVGIDNTDTTFSGTIAPLSGFIGSNIGFAKLGTGTMTILSDQTRTGYTFVEHGVLSINSIADGGVASGIGASSSASGSLLFGNGGTLRYTGAAASTDRLFQLDNGGSNVRTLESSGTGPLNFTNTGPIVNMSGSPAVTFALGGSAGGTFAPGISFNIRFLKLGSGTWTLTGNNTPTGGTTVHDGTLVLSGGGSITHSSANLTVGLNSGDNATFTLSNGTVTAASVLASSSSNSTGHIDLNGGILSTGQVSEGSGTGTVTFNGGTLQLSGNRTNLFAGFEVGDVVLTNSGGTIDTQGFNVATALGLTGNGSLTKTGTGTLTLAGNNTYTGPTTIEQGTLALNGMLTASDLRIESGVKLTGTGVFGDLVLDPGAFIAPGNSIGTISGTSLTWDPGATFVFDLGPGGAGDLIDLSGDFTKGGPGVFAFSFVDAGWEVGQTYTLVEFLSTSFSNGDFTHTNGGGFDGTFALNPSSLTFTVTAVPEPGTVALLAAAASLLAWQRFRSRRCS